MALTDSTWAFPAIESIHVIAISILVGSIAVVDLRLLGLAWAQRDARDVIRSVLPFTWGAFAIALPSGALLFTANPLSYSANFYFVAKLGLLALAGANMLLFHLFVQRRLDQPRSVLPRVSGAASLLLWVVIVGFGRWIGFTL